jgi:beta-lactamase regulating signal transducer with metallopeptidase domain
LITKSELKSAKSREGNIYESDKITSPAVYGVIRPKIVIPAALAQEDLDYVILHEQAHIRRGDNLFWIVAVITACCHWFNPLTWLFLRCFFTDMELACDARVVHNLSEGEARDYARTILACSSGKALFASAFGGAKTRVRIENILFYKKLTLLSSLFFALLIIVIVVIIATNAVV